MGQKRRASTAPKTAAQRRAERRGQADAKSANADASLSDEDRIAQSERRRKRIVLGLLPLLTLAIVFWAWPSFAIGKAHREAVVLNVTAADAWLRRAGWTGRRGDEILLLRSRLARRQGEFERANAFFAEAVQAGLPKARQQAELVLLRSEAGEPERIAQSIELLTEHESLPQIYESWVRGELVRLNAGGVIDRAREWAAEVPSDPRPLIYAARAHGPRYEFNQAEEKLREAVARRPDSGWAWLSLGGTLLISKKYDEALQAARRATELLEVAEPGLVLQASVLRDLGRLDEAEAAIDRALAVPRADVERMYVLLGERPQDAATAALATRAEILLDADRPAEALEAFDRVLAVESDNSAAHFGRAQALRMLGRRDEARAAGERVAEAQQAMQRIELAAVTLADDPGDIDLQRKLGIDLLGFGDRQAGLYWLAKVLDADPRDRASLAALVDFYAGRVAMAEAGQTDDLTPYITDPAAELQAYRRRLEALGEPKDADDE